MTTWPKVKSSMNGFRPSLHLIPNKKYIKKKVEKFLCSFMLEKRNKDQCKIPGFCDLKVVMLRLINKYTVKPV